MKKVFKDKENKLNLPNTCAAQQEHEIVRTTL